MEEFQPKERHNAIHGFNRSPAAGRETWEQNSEGFNRERGGKETEGQVGRDVGKESEATVRGEAERSGNRESKGK